jgi:hypothetical protein
LKIFSNFEEINFLRDPKLFKSNDWIEQLEHKKKELKEGIQIRKKEKLDPEEKIKSLGNVSTMSLCL